MKKTPLEIALYVPMTVAIFIVAPKFSMKMIKFNRDHKAGKRDAE